MSKLCRNATLVFTVLCLSLLMSNLAFGKVRSHFSSKRGTNLDEVILDAWAQAERVAAQGQQATIDVAVFSFTTRELADELLRMARQHPNLSVRLLVDLSQLSQSQSHMAPYIEYAAQADYSNACKVLSGTARRRDCRAALAVLLEGELLDNIRVAYKYYNAYVYGLGGRVVLEHRLSRLMHHKMVLINGQRLVTGSYNFSPTARRKNYENLMDFSGANEQRIVADYAAEFEALWGDDSLVLEGAAVREWRRALIAGMYAALDE